MIYCIFERKTRSFSKFNNLIWFNKPGDVFSSMDWRGTYPGVPNRLYWIQIRQFFSIMRKPNFWKKNPNESIAEFQPWHIIPKRTTECIEVMPVCRFCSWNSTWFNVLSLTDLIASNCKNESNVGFLNFLLWK